MSEKQTPAVYDFGAINASLEEITREKDQAKTTEIPQAYPFYVASDDNAPAEYNYTC